MPFGATHTYMAHIKLDAGRNKLRSSIVICNSYNVCVSALVHVYSVFPCIIFLEFRQDDLQCAGIIPFVMTCDLSIVDDCKNNNYLYSQLLNTVFISWCVSPSRHYPQYWCQQFWSSRPGALAWDLQSSSFSGSELFWPLQPRSCDSRILRKKPYSVHGTQVPNETWNVFNTITTVKR